MNSYGITNKNRTETPIEFHLENLKLKGFSVEPRLLDPNTCDEYNASLIDVYAKQEQDFGKEKIAAINDINIARMPFIGERKFFGLFMNPLVIDLAKRLLGQNLQLHLQNGIINPPDNYHHQAAWHRDLPYQDWVISKPLAINAFYCLTDFTNTNGATFVLPYSHRSDFFPSEKFVIENELQIIAPKGSVIFFDSMLFHRAGYNTSSDVRIGVNNMFVSPIIKQQINIPQAILEKYHIDELSDEEQLILGFKFQLANNVVEYRKRRTNKS